MSSARWPLALVLVVTCLWLQALAEDTVIDFGPEEFVKVDGNDLVVPGYSVPSFVDWNNDHLMDLVVGEGGGTVPGKVRVYLNVGTESDPRFVKYFYVTGQWPGPDLSAPGLHGVLPARGRLGRRQPQGPARRPGGWYGQDLPERSPMTMIRHSTAARRSGRRPADHAARRRHAGDAVLVDWNNDGMPDIVAGGLDGLIHVYYNCGCGGPCRRTSTTSPTARLCSYRRTATTCWCRAGVRAPSSWTSTGTARRTCSPAIPTARSCSTGTSAWTRFRCSPGSPLSFPRLSSILARDGYFPRQFALRGERLAFNSGIVALALVSIALCAAFNGSTDRLIGLYAIGVFTSSPSRSRAWFATGSRSADRAGGEAP